MHAYTYAHQNMYSCTYVNTTHTHTHTNIRVYMHTHIQHTHIHTHIHRYTPPVLATPDADHILHADNVALSAHAYMIQYMLTISIQRLMHAHIQHLVLIHTLSNVCDRVAPYTRFNICDHVACCANEYTI